MEVRIEHTAGLGREAEVLLDGQPLTVCDGVSPSDSALGPGLIENVKFSYMTAEGFSWDEAVRKNPSKRMTLEPVRRWTYEGFGRVVSILPVVVDFGLLRMEDPNWSSDDALTGRFVRIPIDRLELVAAHEPDFPEPGEQGDPVK